MSKFFKIFAVFGLILGFAAPAHAGLVLVIDDGNGNTVTVDDEIDAVTDDGVVSYVGSLGDWSLVSDTSFSIEGSGSLLNTIIAAVYSGDDTGTLTITVYDDSYTAGAGLGYASTEIDGSNIDGSVSACSYIEDAEIACDEDLTESDELTGTIQYDAPDPYTLTQVIVLTAGNGDAFSLDAQTTFSSVPEPAVLGLLGLGLIGVGAARRRKKAA